ncbi:MAG: hypothetical protein WAM44_04580 [Chthoniobacterales bacterium]
MISTYILVEAGTQRYNVGTDTPKLWATSLGGVPEESNFLAALTLPSVIGGIPTKVRKSPRDLA